MGERITKGFMGITFARAFGEDAATDLPGATDNSHNIGKYALDYAACYGGYVVIVYDTGDSGAGYCHGPTSWGTTRRNPREMLSFLQGYAAGKGN